ncbi:MAG: VOC family protein [Bacteroidota bacterium]
MPDPQIISAATILLVGDVVKSANYYRDQLGFQYSRFWGDPPGFCMVWRDPFCLMLSQVEDQNKIVSKSSLAHIWDAYFWVKDVHAMHTVFKARGAMIKDGPSETNYGVIEMTVHDLDGHLICFGQEL